MVAFFVEFPVVSIVLAALFTVAAYWVLRGGRASVAFAGALCLTRLALAIGFSFVGPTTTLSGVEVAIVVLFAVASATGAVAAIVASRTRTSEVRS